MRLEERYKRTVYVANETRFNSKEYGEPYPLRFIVSPKGDNTIFGGGVMTQQNTVELKIESKVKGIELITQNSILWINKVPDPEEEGGDYTHNIVSRDVTADLWFVNIECQTAGGNNPLL